MTNRAGITHRVLTASVVLLIAATAAGFGARWGWILDLLSHPRPHYLFGLIVSGALLASRGRRGWAGAAAAAALVNAAFVVPVFLPQFPRQAADPERSLSVMALNVGVTEADVDALASYLRGRDDDLVFLFAATDRYSKPLAEANIPQKVVVARPGGSSLEIVLLARDPEIATHVRWWGDDVRSAAVEAVVELDGVRIRVLGTHPKSPRTPERMRHRDRQLARLGRWAAERADAVLIVGDLNATPWSPTFRDMMSEGELVNSLRSRLGVQPSWHTPWTWAGIPIDHAIHSPDLVTVERYLGPSFGSDHRSLHITVSPALRPPPSRRRSSRTPAGAPRIAR